MLEHNLRKLVNAIRSARNATPESSNHVPLEIGCPQSLSFERDNDPEDDDAIDTTSTISFRNIEAIMRCELPYWARIVIYQWMKRYDIINKGQGTPRRREIHGRWKRFFADTLEIPEEFSQRQKETPGFEDFCSLVKLVVENHVRNSKQKFEALGLVRVDRPKKSGRNEWDECTDSWLEQGWKGELGEPKVPDIRMLLDKVVNDQTEATNLLEQVFLHIASRSNIRQALQMFTTVLERNDEQYHHGERNDFGKRPRPAYEWPHRTFDAVSTLNEPLGSDEEACVPQSSLRIPSRNSTSEDIAEDNENAYTISNPRNDLDLPHNPCHDTGHDETNENDDIDELRRASNSLQSKG